LRLHSSPRSPGNQFSARNPGALLPTCVIAAFVAVPSAARLMMMVVMMMVDLESFTSEEEEL